MCTTFTYLLDSIDGSTNNSFGFANYLDGRLVASKQQQQQQCVNGHTMGNLLINSKFEAIFLKLNNFSSPVGLLGLFALSLWPMDRGAMSQRTSVQPKSTVLI